MPFDNGTSIHFILAVAISYENEKELPSSRLTFSFHCYTDKFVSISLSTGTLIIHHCSYGETAKLFLEPP